MALSFYTISCNLVLSHCNDSSLSSISVKIGIFRVSPKRFLSCGLACKYGKNILINVLVCDFCMGL